MLRSPYRAEALGEGHILLKLFIFLKPEGTPTRNPNGVILNRDRNACKNILLIMKEFLQTQTRKAEFSRKQIVDS